MFEPGVKAVSARAAHGLGSGLSLEIREQAAMNQLTGHQVRPDPRLPTDTISCLTAGFCSLSIRRMCYMPLRCFKREFFPLQAADCPRRLTTAAFIHYLAVVAGTKYAHIHTYTHCTCMYAIICRTEHICNKLTWRLEFLPFPDDGRMWREACRP